MKERLQRLFGTWEGHNHSTLGASAPYYTWHTGNYSVCPLCPPARSRNDKFMMTRDAAFMTRVCYRYFPKVSPIFDIDAGFKSIVDTDIDTLP